MNCWHFMFILLIKTGTVNSSSKAKSLNERSLWSMQALSTHTGTGRSLLSNTANRFRRSVTETYNFDENLQSAAVEAHNAARRQVIPQASDMMEMIWDPELARLATGYSKTCQFEHNQNRPHSRFGYVGENIYLSSGVTFNQKYVTNSVVSWDDEKKDYNFKGRSCTPGKACGHYTQVVWAESFAVGCGASLCSTVNVGGAPWKNAIVLICNYGPGGNFNGRFPYVPGKPCHNCSDPSDTCREGLCYNSKRYAELENGSAIAKAHTQIFIVSALLTLLNN